MNIKQVFQAVESFSVVGGGEQAGGVGAGGGGGRSCRKMDVNEWPWYDVCVQLQDTESIIK